MYLEINYAVCLIFCLHLELKLTQSIEFGLRSGGTRRTGTDPREASQTETQLQHVKNNSNPSTEDTINLINNRLKERRRELGLPEAVKVGVHGGTDEQEPNYRKLFKDRRVCKPSTEADRVALEDHLGCACVCRTCPVSR